MVDGEVQEDDILTYIDVEDLFVSFPDDFNLFRDEFLVPTEACTDGLVQESSNPSPDSATSWIREVEEILMEDEKEVEEGNKECFNELFSDILHEISDNQSQEIKIFTNEDSNAESNDSDVVQEKEKFDASGVEKNEEDDPITKKRKRQMRNRDAALRSRERKKMYVKDLEMKSRYLEGECIRLQRLLQCCASENHALHLQLQKDKAIVASSTKQESAALLLESLLLGSLLWLVGIVCLFSLPGLLCPALEAPVLLNMDSKDRESLNLIHVRVARNEKTGLGSLRLFFKRKQCKATRWRMKPVFLICAVLA